MIAQRLLNNKERKNLQVWANSAGWWDLATLLAAAVAAGIIPGYHAVGLIQARQNFTSSVGVEGRAAKV